MVIDTVWGWAVLACPIAFVAGFVWIRRAKELETPVDGVPTHGKWLAISLGAIAVVVVFGGAIIMAGFSHSGGVSPLVLLALFTLFVGPFAYGIYADRWINRVRLALRAQRRNLRLRQRDIQP